MLIDKEYARLGEKFYFKVSDECMRCKYKEICLKDKIEDMLYEVIEVKRPLHKIVCKITGREAYLVRVKPVNLKIALPTKDVIVGASLYYSPIHCGEERCPYLSYCKSNITNQGKSIKIKILKIIGEIDCPLSKKLTLVEAELL